MEIKSLSKINNKEMGALEHEQIQSLKMKTARHVCLVDLQINR